MRVRSVATRPHLSPRYTHTASELATTPASAHHHTLHRSMARSHHTSRQQPWAILESYATVAGAPPIGPPTAPKANPRGPQMLSGRLWCQVDGSCYTPMRMARCSLGSTLLPPNISCSTLLPPSISCSTLLDCHRSSCLRFRVPLQTQVLILHLGHGTLNYFRPLCCEVANQQDLLLRSSLAVEFDELIDFLRCRLSALEGAEFQHPGLGLVLGNNW